MNQIILNYLTANCTDPFQKYIFEREILLEMPSQADIDAIHESKWYKRLADEQWDDGSWGRFHSMDSRDPVKRKFTTTEGALNRAYDLGLTKDDVLVSKCISYMERIVNGEETWRDNIEKHHDNGKSHMQSRPFLTAAALSRFDPDNEAVKPKREVFVNTLKVALSDGFFDESAWEAENKSYRGPCLNGWNAYPFMILQKPGCMPDELQRQYLKYIWDKPEGIYYVSGLAVSEKISFEDRRFKQWLSAFDLLSGFTLFMEFANDTAMPHLISELERLITSEIELPSPPFIIGHYAESWRNKAARKTDMVLKIARVIAKCVPALH